MKKIYQSLLLPALIGLVVTLCILFVSEWLIEQDLTLHQQEFEKQVESRTDYISHKLQQELNHNLIVIEAIESLLLFNNDISGSKFSILADKLLLTRPSIMQVQLSPNAEVKYVFPRAGNESIIGLKLRDIPGQKEVVERSIKSGEMIMAGPLNLLQGGKGFIARKPLYNMIGANKQFWGFITLIIDTPSFYAASQLETKDSLTQYALRGRNAAGAEGETFFGDSDIFDGKTALRNINIPGGSWQLSASLEEPLNHHSVTMLSLWGAVAAIAFGFLSAAFTFIWFKLYKQATHDHLSGLLNRQHFQSLAETEIIRAKRYNFSLALIMIDLDHFKQINDKHGHQSGDKVIKETAQLINAAVRSCDLVGRYGGEEFLVLVPHNSDQSSLQCAKRIHRTLQRTINIGGNSMQLSASLGLCSLSEEVNDYHELIRHADQALYKAKETGRNQVICCEQK